MARTLSDIIANLVAALLGAAVTYLAVRARQKVRQQALNRAVRLFFGFPGQVIVVHSAILDRSQRPASYSYPATDTRAARTVARLFESVGLHEGTDFTIHPDRPDRQLPVDKLSELNVVLLCGPARNSIFDKVAAVLPMRYSMTVASDGKNVLVDRRREQPLLSSRELPDQPGGPAFDWGLVASLPSPYNLGRRLVILAGVHGTGTVGAAEFVADVRNLAVLNDRRVGETVSEVVRVDYDGVDIETPTRIELV